jgi:hypothetical protein
MADEVLLRLTADEALVLFEWLHRMEETGSYAAVVEDPAETVALWNLLALFERELVEPLQDDYAGMVAAARARLKAE